MKNHEERCADYRHASSISSSYYPNMDLMRYVLSIAVIIAHADYLTGYGLPFPFSSFEAVGGFFAISGFLMYPNYVRHGNALSYTRQRVRRILPPYLVIVVACALGFCLVSDLPPASYFSSEGLVAYLGANISFLNWLHPGLPGVFQGDGYVTDAVNGSLWTMKVEWCLYFSVPCFIWLLSVIKHVPRHWMALLVIALSIVYRLLFTYLYASTGNEIYNILRRQIFGQLAFFYTGMLVWFIRDFFASNIRTILVCGVVLKVLLPYVPSVVQIIVEPFAISAVVVALSLLPCDIKWLRHRRNVSYEMYLFHFPLIQLGIWLGLPSVGKGTMLAFTFAATVILALIVHLAVERCLLSARH
ncbi:MAG: acyltransferase [Muribaculaceae bacterium]|nr:acyltransferase [Muribaculaceae bacterium]